MANFLYKTENYWSKTTVEQQEVYMINSLLNQSEDMEMRQTMNVR